MDYYKGANGPQEGTKWEKCWLQWHTDSLLMGWSPVPLRWCPYARNLTPNTFHWLKNSTKISNIIRDKCRSVPNWLFNVSFLQAHQFLPTAIIDIEMQRPSFIGLYSTDDIPWILGDSILGDTIKITWNQVLDIAVWVTSLLRSKPY